MDPYTNIFGDEKRILFAWWARARMYMFIPLLKVLDALHVSAGMLSFLSFASAVAGAAMFHIDIHSALWLLVFHLFFDSIDGSLARYQRKASRRGVFIDQSVDYIGLVVVVLGLVYAEMLDPFWLSAYLSSMLVMVFLLILLSFLKKNYPYILRSRDVFYVFLCIQFWGGLPYVMPFLILFSVYNTAMSLYLFWKLKCSL
jgi:phosphatidylglycerophosphate synthase